MANPINIMQIDGFIPEVRVPLIGNGIDPTKYTVSNTGYIFGADGKMLHQSISSKKFPTVSLCRIDGSRKTYRVDKLVAGSFCDNDDPENKKRIIHKNNVETNCMASNMQWATDEEYDLHKKYTDSEYIIAEKDTVGWKTSQISDQDRKNLRELRNLGMNMFRAREILGLDEKISDRTLRDIYYDRVKIEVQP